MVCALLLCAVSSGASASWHWQLDTRDAAQLNPAQQVAAAEVFDAALAVLPPAWRDAEGLDVRVQWRDDLRDGVHGHSRGDRVLLRYQAYPYQKFGHQIGKVERITRSALSGADLGIPLGKAQPGESYYRVTVELAKQSVTAYGQQEQLKPGMGLDADILGEKRRLIEWIFEPLYSLRGKVSTV